MSMFRAFYDITKCKDELYLCNFFCYLQRNVSRSKNRDASISSHVTTVVEVWNIVDLFVYELRMSATLLGKLCLLREAHTRGSNSALQTVQLYLQHKRPEVLQSRTETR